MHKTRICYTDTDEGEEFDIYLFTFLSKSFLTKNVGTLHICKFIYCIFFTFFSKQNNDVSQKTVVTILNDATEKAIFVYITVLCYNKPLNP